jgi:hypothetical protein
VIHNLGIQELHLGVARILTILMQPSPLIKKCIYKEEVWRFLSKYGSCECNESKTSLWLKINSICVHCLACGNNLSMIFIWLSHCPNPISDLFQVQGTREHAPKFSLFFSFLEYYHQLKRFIPNILKWT